MGGTKSRPSSQQQRKQPPTNGGMPARCACGRGRRCHCGARPKSGSGTSAAASRWANSRRTMKCYPIVGQDADNDGSPDMWCQTMSASGSSTKDPRIVTDMQEVHEAKSWSDTQDSNVGWSFFNTEKGSFSSSAARNARTGMRRSATSTTARSRNAPSGGGCGAPSLPGAPGCGSNGANGKRRSATRSFHAIRNGGVGIGAGAGAGADTFPPGSGSSSMTLVESAKANNAPTTGFGSTFQNWLSSIAGGGNGGNGNGNAALNGMMSSTVEAIQARFQDFVTYDYVVILVLVAVLCAISYGAAGALVDRIQCLDYIDAVACAEVVIPNELLMRARYLIGASIVWLIISARTRDRPHYALLITGIICGTVALYIEFWLTIPVPGMQWIINVFVVPALALYAYRVQPLGIF